jgi:hypothetical protein
VAFLGLAVILVACDQAGADDYPKRFCACLTRRPKKRTLRHAGVEPWGGESGGFESVILEVDGDADPGGRIRNF